MMPQLPTLLRPARHEDCPQILRVHRHAVRYSCLKSYTPEIMNAWLDLLEPESYLGPIDNPNKAADLSLLSLYASKNSIEFYRINGYESLGEAIMPLNEHIQAECLLMRKYLSQ